MRHLFTMWPVALPVQCTPLAAQPGAGTLGHCQPCRLPRRFRVLRSNSKASPQLVRAAPEGFTFPDSAEAAVSAAACCCMPQAAFPACYDCRLSVQLNACST